MPEKEIAELISKGVIRFYELKKYITLDGDQTGRSDENEGNVYYPEAKDINVPGILTKMKLGDFEFECSGISFSAEYLYQYFVFCLSYERIDNAILDTKYMVELDSNIFDIIKFLTAPFEPDNEKNTKYKFFHHDKVRYYDIDNQLPMLENERWRSIFKKHSLFSHQKEYRAFIFLSNEFFEDLKLQPFDVELDIADENGNPLDIKLECTFRSGVDDGWRYIEFDISRFASKVIEPLKIVTLDRATSIS